MTGPVPQRSLDLFESGYYCAESVLLSIAESRGIQSDWIPRIATGFCSGVARTGGMCGAVSGAIMAISLAAGRDAPSESMESCYALIRQLVTRFERQHGSANCLVLTGCDLATPQGQQSFIENQVMTRCNQYVMTAAGLAESLISQLPPVE
jgi:C_GCAxxG_C_C family probable redox protein